MLFAPIHQQEVPRSRIRATGPDHARHCLHDRDDQGMLLIIIVKGLSWSLLRPFKDRIDREISVSNRRQLCVTLCPAHSGRSVVDPFSQGSPRISFKMPKSFLLVTICAALLTLAGADTTEPVNSSLEQANAAVSQATQDALDGANAAIEQVGAAASQATEAAMAEADAAMGDANKEMDNASKAVDACKSSAPNDLTDNNMKVVTITGTTCSADGKVWQMNPDDAASLGLTPTTAASALNASPILVSSRTVAAVMSVAVFAPLVL